ncbi:hypothetical protein [Sporosarcina obsidiansis]|uniref:hypothetical protein n=1 Tax=Sporosarcina obsidiansis TaxID=2660748 RepID=UPI00129A8C04|nr:hypothetical protein [Sporosarcina obsidiansis]
MNITWTQIVNSLLPLLGVAVGGIATYMTQTNVLKRQLSRELEKEKQVENIARLKIYSEILKLVGEHEMIVYDGGREKFNLKVYRANFRPKFFSEFYLLHQDLADDVRSMDITIAEAELTGYMDREMSGSLSRTFNNLIEKIEIYLKEYRSLQT